MDLNYSTCPILLLRYPRMTDCKKPRSVVTIPPSHPPLPHWHPGSSREVRHCTKHQPCSFTLVPGGYCVYFSKGILQECSGIWLRRWSGDYFGPHSTHFAVGDDRHAVHNLLSDVYSNLYDLPIRFTACTTLPRRR